MTVKPHYQFGIIGAGLVGSLAALMLASQGYSVALIDPKGPAQFKTSPDLRVSALTPASLNLLRELGVLAKLKPERFSKILSMKIFESEEAPIQFYASEVGREQLGIIIENEILLKAIEELFPAQVHRLPLKCNNLKRHNSGFELELSNAQVLAVEYLILAQGNHTALAQSLAIPFETFDYHEEALVFHVESEQAHQHTAYQRFMPTGPLAFLPLYNDHWSSIVWTLPKARAEYLKTADLETLTQELQNVFPSLGRLKIISKVASFPMYAQKAQVVAGKCFALMGDAAHTVHPLAGQGVNLGFRDVAVFAKMLREVQLRKMSLNSSFLADSYRDATLGYNRMMSRSFSLIHYFFAPSPLSKLRQIGAKYLNRIVPLKKELMKIAMGERLRP